MTPFERFVAPESAPTTKLDRAIAKILAESDSDCGAEYPVQVSDPRNSCHTGLFQLDLIFSGGFRGGRMYTHVAPASGGKSSLMQEHLIAAQLQHMLIYYFDIEQSAEGSYMLRQGAQTPSEYKLPDGSKGFYYLPIEYGEEVYRLALGFLDQLPILSPVDQATKPPKVLMLTDGYESMNSEGASPTKHPLGISARMHSTYQRMLHAALRKVGATWVATNQTRTSGIGSFFVNSEDDGGGQALKFYADAKTFLRSSRPGSSKTDEETESKRKAPPGVSMVNIETRKNKLCLPFQKIVERLYVGQGFDKLFDRLRFLVSIGEITQDGTSFVIEGKRTPFDRARKLMKEPEWYKLCRAKRRDPEVYVRYFGSRMAKPDW